MSYVFGDLFAGWFNEYYGWRATFVVLGIVGLALAALAGFSLKEPRVERLKYRAPNEGSVDIVSANSVPRSAVKQANIKEVFFILIRNRTYRNLLLSNSVISFFGFASGQWLPAFFMRSYGLGTGELGAWIAAIQGISGGIAMYLGGELASRFAAKKEGLQLRVTALAYVGAGILWSCVYFSTNFRWSFGFMALATIAGTAPTGPLFALIQSLTSQQYRAQSVAVLNLFGNLIGLGLGPLAAGTLSDMLHSSVGNESLRYALLATCPGTLWAALYVLAASKTVARDLDAVESEDQSSSSREAKLRVTVGTGTI